MSSSALSSDGCLGGESEPVVLCGEVDSLVCNSHMADQIASLLSISRKISRRVFLGESISVVTGMCRWVISEKDEEDDLEGFLTSWAKVRGRGMWRSEDRRVERCPRCFSQPQNASDVSQSANGNANGNGRARRLPSTDSCTCCMGSGVQLKAIGIKPASFGGE